MIVILASHHCIFCVCYPFVLTKCICILLIFHLSTYRDEDVHQDKLWVFVFGFGQDTSDDAILRNFQGIGQISQKFGSDKTDGNYMLIRFMTPYEAKRALEYNGKRLPNRTTIGVLPIDDKSTFPLYDYI